MEEYGLTPNVGIQFPNGKDYSITNSTEGNEIKSTKLELDNMGLPKIKVKYMRVKNQKNSKRKMLCLSGWKPEPEEFVLKRENEVVSLKSMGARYIKYNTVYSKESNQLYYFPCNETTDVLAKPQSELDKIIFNKRRYISIPEENTNRNNCIAEKDDEMDTKQDCNKCKIVYKLIDGGSKEKCEQGQDGCICSGEACSRLTQYLNKEDGQSFYLRYEEVDCKDKDGKTLKNEKGEIQKCTQLKDQPVKANRTEVFYADKLCRLDLAGLKNGLREIIVKQLKDKKQKLEESNQGSYELGNSYTGDLSPYDYVEIEAWGGGEAGHIADKAQSTESRPGIPGDYIKAKLKIDPSHPVIKVKVMEGGGGLTSHISNKDGGPTFIKMCKNSSGADCKDLITIAGGGKHRTYNGKEYRKTKVHIDELKLREPTIVTGTSSTQGKQIAYIENGQIKYKDVKECRVGYIDRAYGAGGCINRSSETYGRGSPGYVKVKPMLDEFNESKIKKIDSTIKEIIQNPNSIENIGDPWISKLDPDIINTIKKEIRKELLGL
ncbi:hypothetical protein IHO40_04805 [Wolbachia endosymbiont of Mansonella ozzardi]|nr:hypothetical protein [Wolbachia endosymbiont of Mansonella ozzardi]